MSVIETLTDIPARARKLGAEAIGIDSHVDTAQRVLVMGEDLGQRWNVGHVDIPRLHEGGTHAPFFALWVIAVLLERGYQERDVKKILGENTLRVIREVTGR